MNVLSLFDGISCGCQALEEAGIIVDQYFASEIDKHAIAVSKNRWPHIEHVGDVTRIAAFMFPKIDLIIGGSPCQDLRPGREGLKGKKSKLFYEYLRILREIQLVNPEVKFLLENVFLISKEDKSIITQLLGVEPILLNSGLVSAQNRKRYYWSNIPFLGPPKDLNLFLRDITLGGEMYLLRWQNSKTGPVVDIKCNTLKALSGRGGVRQQPIIFTDLLLTPEEINRAHIKYRGKTWKSGNRMGTMKFPDDTDKKSKTICATTTTIKAARETIHIVEGENTRILHPVEYERLQTLPDNYTELIPRNARYRVIGNGWTVKIIAHLLKPLNPAYDFLF